jgi:hypothetical protein
VFRTIRWRFIIISLLATGVPLMVFASVLATLLWQFYLRHLEAVLFVILTVWLAGTIVRPVEHHRRIFTAKSAREDFDQARQFNLAGFFTKPYGTADVLRHVEKVLATRRQIRPERIPTSEHQTPGN